MARAFQRLEIVWLTTLANRTPWAVEFDHLDPVYFVVNAVALLGAAWLLSRKRFLPANHANDANEKRFVLRLV